MSDQKVCPTCGTEYPLSERFCPRDGTALRSSNAQADLIGSIVAERYHILKKLGEGGMGTVYLAEHVKMGRKAALKVMNPGMNSDADAIARFNREAANASRLNHPNVCGIYDFGETSDGLIYLAMEFIEGESLTSLIQKNGSLAAPRAASIIHQAADALAVAHDYGIVHRDLKPDNIMIAKGRDGSDLVKVVDFGIAKASTSDAQKVTKTGLVVGTPEYMSPEQLSGDKLDGRSDIYSLGLVAFNCLTGTLPFPSESAQETMIMRLTDQPKTLAEMRPDIAWPAELQAVMDKVLSRDVTLRYQKSSDFGRDMAKAVEHMPAAVAAQAGTMVMGSAPAAAAPAAATAALPKTRLAAKSSATAKMDAVMPATTAPAPGKKSPVMMIAAALVVIAAAGGGYALLGGKKDGAVSPPSGGAQPNKPVDTTSKTAEAVKPDPNAQKSGAQPGGQVGGGAPKADPVQKYSKTAAPAPVGPATTKAPSGETQAELFKRLGAALNEAEPTSGDAKDALDAVNPLIPKLTGMERSNASYLQMMAYVVLKDERACRAAADVLANDPTAKSDKQSNFVKVASTMRDGCSK